MVLQRWSFCTTEVRTEDVCNKHLKAPDMLIQCILVYIILYFRSKNFTTKTCVNFINIRTKLIELVRTSSYDIGMYNVLMMVGSTL